MKVMKIWLKVSSCQCNNTQRFFRFSSKSWSFYNFSYIECVILGLLSFPKFERSGLRRLPIPDAQKTQFLSKRKTLENFIRSNFSAKSVESSNSGVKRVWSLHLEPPKAGFPGFHLCEFSPAIARPVFWACVVSSIIIPLPLFIKR